MGTFTYSTDSRAEWLRFTTEAHNTIEIDDKPQKSTAAGGISHLITNPVFDLIGANTESSAGVRHERSVLSLHSGLWVVSDRLKPVDTAAHRYEQNWHFASDADPSIRSGTEATTTAFATGANLTIVPADPARVASDLRDGYYAPRFYSVENAKYASYVKTATGQATFDTLLLPSKGAADTSRDSGTASRRHHPVVPGDGPEPERWCGDLLQVLDDEGAAHVRVLHLRRQAALRRHRFDRDGRRLIGRT